MKNRKKKQVALFRFRVIYDFVGNTKLARGAKERLLREKCSLEWEIPFSQRTRLSRGTILRWITIYKKNGWQVGSLYPRGRSDNGIGRSIDKEIGLSLIRLRNELPGISVPSLIKEMKIRETDRSAKTLKLSTVYRFLHQHKLMKSKKVASKEFKTESTLTLKDKKTDIVPHLETTKIEKIAVALFRFGVIFDLIYIHKKRGDQEQLLKKKASQKWVIPFSERTRICRGSILRWKRLYENSNGQLDSLYPRDRSDRKKNRSMDERLCQLIINLRKEMPYLTVPDFIKELKQREEVTEESTLNQSTVYRFLHHQNLMKLQVVKSGKLILKNKCPVRFIRRDERMILEEWRKSKNRKKWEKAVAILENWNMDIEELSLKIEKPTGEIRKWIKAFNANGLKDLKIERKKIDKRKIKKKIELKTKRIVEILHQKPTSFGVNRSVWSLKTLSDVYEKKYNEKISGSTVRHYLKIFGYSIRKARKVLTSPDPDYKEKVDLLLCILRSLKTDEDLFFIDELGPLRVIKYGGKCYIKKGEVLTIPQTQISKGSITLNGALSVIKNQVTWNYGKSKDTSAMIDLIEILFNQYHDKSIIYITWDAASWHNSNALIEWADAFNNETNCIGEGPLIDFIPLPSRSQFLNVIEAVFSGMKRAVIHHSNYQSEQEMKSVISLHFQERNEHFKKNPKRAGKKIWEIDFFKDYENIRSGDYREW